MFKIIAMIACLAPALASAGVSGRTSAAFHGTELTIHTYKPDCEAKGVMLVFHGNERTASSYRDAAKTVADRECLAVYAPLFDEARFPSSQYHRGGVTVNGPTEGRTIDMVDDMMAWADAQEGGKALPVTLFGHSAGGQFLSRVAAYVTPARTARIVIANPSTHVLPNGTENAPYGFDLNGDDVLDAAEEAMMRAYLAAPVTIYLGTADTGTEDLAMTAAAMRQGVDRLDRGRKTFEASKAAAEDNCWSFGWRLVFAEGAGHSAGQMLRAPEMEQAMEPEPQACEG